MNDKPRIQLESLAFPITAHRLGIGKLAYHIMTFNQYIGLTSSMNCIKKNKNIAEYPTEGCRLTAGASPGRHRSL